MPSLSEKTERIRYVCWKTEIRSSQWRILRQTTKLHFL